MGLCGCVRHKLQKFEYLLEDVSYESLNAENLIKYNESTTRHLKNLIVAICVQVQNVHIPEQVRNLVERVRNVRSNQKKTYQPGEYRILQRIFATSTELRNSELVNTINKDDI